MSYVFDDGKPPRGALGGYEFEDERAPTALDVAKQALIGYIPDTAKGLGWILEKAGIDYGTRMREAGAETERQILESMTPGGRRAAETPVFEGEGLSDLSLSDDWGRALLMGGVRSIPQMAMMAPVGAPIAAGVAKAIPAAATRAPGVLGTVARNAPGGVGFGVAEGLQAGALNAAETAGQIEAMDPERLAATSPRYRELLEGMDPESAKRVLAQEASSQVFRETAPWTGGVGVLTGGGALGELVKRGARGGIPRAVVRGAGEEALQEIPQSGGEQFIQNRAERAYVDDSTDPWRQVVSQALSGGAIGGVTGGVVGGAARAARGRVVDGEVTGRTASPMDVAREAVQESERAVDVVRRTVDKLRAKVSGQPKEISDGDGTGVVSEAAATGAQPPAGAGTEAGTEAAGAAAGQRQAVLRSDFDDRAHEAAPSPENDRTEPTLAQIEAGNYKKGHADVWGMDISVENPAGSTRRDTKNDPPRWETKLADHYGYIRRTTGFDKDHLDAFVKPGTKATFSGPVYIVNQGNDDGAFDEHKVMLGYGSQDEAREAYLRNFDDRAKAVKRLRSIVALPMDKFKEWAFDSKNGPSKGEYVIPPSHWLDEKLTIRAVTPQQPAPDGVETFTTFEAARDARIAKLKANAAAKKQIDVGKDSVIDAVMKLGGISMDNRLDIIGDEKGNRSVMGVGHLFTNAGTGIDDMATLLGQYGYLTAEELEDVDGGVQALKDKIRDEFDGRRKHWSVNSDAAFEEEMRRRAEIDEEMEAAAQAAAAEAAESIGPDWATMTEEEKDAELDALFGPESREGAADAAGPQEGAAAGEGDAGPEVPDEAGEREPGSDDEEVDGERPLAARGNRAEIAARTGGIFDEPAPAAAPAAESTGTSPQETREIGELFSEAEAREEGDEQVTHVFDAPKQGDIVRIEHKVRVHHKQHGWMTIEQAKAKIKEWKDHAAKQGDGTENSDRVVLSLFDLTGEWSKPWAEAGYQVYRFDIQDDWFYEDPDTGEKKRAGDIKNFSTDFFNDMFGAFEGNDVYAILAACPCTDFAVSGARHFAAKDADGRTVESVQLVEMTLAAIEFFKPAVWAIENPVGRIEKLTGLPPWRMSFDPNHFGDPYTKKTLLWGRFNGDLPVAPVEPTEGSKMHKKFGGKSQKTKNARSVTPEGFAYSFFMANNALDHPAMAIANKYDRLDRRLIEKAVAAGITEEQVDEAVEDFYYQDLDDRAANDAIRALIQGKPRLELTGQTEAEIRADEDRKRRADEGKRRKEAAPAPEDFTLTGSSRPADEAAARGQQGLFDAPAAQTQEGSQPALSDEEREALSKLDEEQWKPSLAIGRVPMLRALARRGLVESRPTFGDVGGTTYEWRLFKKDRFEDDDARNGFAVDRINSSTGEEEHVAFRRGEYVKAWMSGSVAEGNAQYHEGDIVGISRIKRQAMVRGDGDKEGVWFDWGAIYKAKRPEKADTRSKEKEILEDASRDGAPKASRGGRAPMSVGMARDVLKHEFSGVDFYLSEHQATGNWKLYDLIVPKAERGRGVGTQFMERLTDMADEAGATLILSPAQRDDNMGTTSRGRLVRFYRRFGFVENRGRRKDFTIAEGMYRRPQGGPKASRRAVTETPEFKAWFRDSKVVDADGKPLVVYHGTGRPDRVGDRFRKSRATSGPMAYFTDSPEIGSGYASGKQDTSLTGEELDYEQWFVYTPKGARTPRSIVQMWWGLPEETRSKFNDMMRRIRQNEETGELEDGGEGGGISPSTYDWNLREARGNGFKAAIELWLSSGALFNSEHEFLRVLRLAGIDIRGIEYIEQNSTTPAVYPVYLSIQNPLDTGAVPQDVLDALGLAARRARRPRGLDSGDMWDKMRRDPKEWVAELHRDIAEGKNSYVWSSIPDFVTDTLRRLGYDGIKDTGGKGGGQDHVVWVPFEENQIKSVNNRGTFDPSKRSIMASRQSENVDDYKLQTRPAKSGQPLFWNAHIGLGLARLEQDRGGGERTVYYGIFDAKAREDDGTPVRLGDLRVDVDADGKFTALRMIEIRSGKRQKGLGWGETVVASLLAHNGGRSMRVLDIQHHTEDREFDALPFWRKMGTRLDNYATDPNVQIDGTLTLRDYLRARGVGGKLSVHGHEDPAREATGAVGAAAPDGERRDRVPGDRRDPGAPQGRGRPGDRSQRRGDARQDPDDGGPAREPRAYRPREGSAAGRRPRDPAGHVGLSAAQVRARLIEAFGPKIDALIQDRILNIVETPADLPPRLRRAARSGDEAWYDPKANDGAGGIYIIASALRPERVVPVLLHELGEHFNLPTMLGSVGYANLHREVRALHARGTSVVVEDAWRHVRENYPDLKESDDDFASEVIARVGETAAGRRLPFFRRLLAKIREWLLRFGLKRDTVRNLTDEDLRILVEASARQAVERAGSGASSARERRSAKPGIFFSELARRIDDVKTNAAPATQWKATIKAMPGVKADEVEWSGINEWLDLQSGKVSKEAVLDYLRENGVRVEETVLGDSPQERRATSERDRLVVELDAMGYTIEEDIDPNTQERVITGATRRSDGVTIPFDGAGFYFGDPDAEVPERLAAIGRRLGELAYELPYRDSMDPETTKYSSYTLPGGTNYRELLLTLPMSDRDMPEGFSVFQDESGWGVRFPDGRELGGWPTRESAIRSQARQQGSSVFQSSHFDQPNILAHVRFDERTDAEGKRVLFIEEIQSDWAQKGKREGFIKPIEKTAGWEQELANLQERDSVLLGIIAEQNPLATSGNRTAARKVDEAQREHEEISERLGELRRLERENFTRGGVPEAPFVGKTEAWVGLALKRMIRWASENGFDRVAWTTGEQQVDRYDLSKHISQVLVRPNVPGKTDFYLLTAYDPQGGTVIREGIDDLRKLDDYLGKEAADKARTQIAGSGSADLRGLDLKVGGEGMRTFYDKIVPNVANGLLKKIGGGRVGTVQIGMEVTVPEARRRGIEVRSDRALVAVNEQPGFDITPQMREAALKGMPLFSRRPVSHRARAHGMPAEVNPPISSTSRPDHLRAHHAYAAAKAGDPEAAADLVHAFVRPQDLAAARERFGSDVLFAPPIAEEATGHNAIPTALAMYYASETGGAVATGFVQANRAHHTGAKAMERLIVRPLFHGKVQKGAKYVLVDDVTTMGSTLAELANHIRAGGGEVVGAVVLANASRTATMAPPKAQIRLIERRYGEVLREEFGIEPGALTAAEAGYVVGFRDADSLRARARSARAERADRLASKALSEGEGGVKASRGAAPAISVREHRGRNGDRSHITRVEEGMVPVSAIRHLAGERGEVRGAHRNRQGKDWDDFLADVRENGVQEPVLIIKDWGKPATVYEGNHRIDAAIELGLERIPAEIRYFGNSQKQGLVLPDSEYGDAPKASRGAAADVQGDFFDKPDAPKEIDLRSLKGSETLADRAKAYIGALFESERTFNWWHRSVGTQYHKATVSEPFRRAFVEGQDYLTDTNRFSMQAEELAPDVLLRVEGLRDLAKRPPAKADLEAAGKALFEGTLHGGASPMKGKVWTDEELVKRGLTDKQIRIYRQVRAAVDDSVETVAKSTIARLMRTWEIRADREMSIDDMAAAVTERLNELRAEAFLALEQTVDDPKALLHRSSEVDAIDQAIEKVEEIRSRTKSLQAAGYMPLMRFGRYTVNVYETDGKGGAIERYFGLYETQAEANIAAKALREQFPDAVVDKGVMSKDAYRIFKGISPDTIELFADVAGLDEHPLIQKYIQLAVSERSALKRLLQRKGTPGFSWDIPRVLAQFIASNSRVSSGNYHHAEMLKAVDEIPQNQGDVKDEAVRLYEYLTNPQEEAGALRGYLFFHFLGGSVAAAMVNMTQPVLMTSPWLAQHANAGKVAKEVGKAMVEASRDKIPGDEAGEAMKRAIDEGVVAPHEIYQLMAEARGGIGRSVALRQITRAWGGLFSLAEAWNRKTTFLAAYRIGKANNVGDPYAFAVRAVHETQGLYNRGNRPNWARGPIGSTVFTFKQYSVTYLEFLKRLPPAQQALALGILVLASGIQGLPGADDFDDIVDTLGQWMGFATNTRRWKRSAVEGLLGEGAGQFVMHGVSSLPGVPLDVQMRLGLGNLIPGTSIFKPSEGDDKGREIAEVLGPAGGLAKSAFDVGRELFQGDVAGAAKAGLPLALKNAYYALEMFQSGEYRDTRGRRVVDVGAQEAFVKAIGFNPAVVARESRKITEARTSIELQRQIETSIAEDMVRAILNRDDDDLEEARQRLRDWNNRNPELPITITNQQLRQRVLQARRSRRERFVRSAAPEIRGRVAADLRE